MSLAPWRAHPEVMDTSPHTPPSATDPASTFRAGAASAGGPRRRSGATWVWVLVIAVAAAPVVMGAGWFAWMKTSGTPFWDEWSCSEGEAPVLVEGGGSFCATPGTTLEEGQAWDPFGNRPFACHDRWGYTEVFRPAARGDDATVTECVAEGREIPAGWKPVPDGWKSGEELPTE